MQPCLNQSQPTPHQIKNILIRHNCSTRVEFNSDYQHPEADYIRKYSPKYYQGLTLEVTRQNPLLSKIKKIKKLKRFTGLFKDNIQPKLWFVLLANHQREIEEIPEIVPTNKDRIRPPRSFWRKLNQFFLNVKNLSFSSRFSGRSSDFRIIDRDYVFSTKELFVRYVGNLRRLGSVEILIKPQNYHMTKWIIEKFNRMSRFFSRLEKFKIHFTNPEDKVSELLENNQVFLHVTDLDLSGKYSPVFSKIIESCKNLKSLSFKFSSLADQKPEFSHFLTSLHHLSQLKSLESMWESETLHLWGQFKPQSSLRYLKLKFKSEESLFRETKPEDFVRHWEEIKELDELDLDIFCWKAEDILLMGRLITMILKKVQKLRSLKIDIKMPNLTGRTVTYEPFFIEEVSHLYESLERFEHILHLWSSNDSTRFDLEVMKPFRNLKELKLDGSCNLYENIDRAVILLKENQYAVLELKLSAKKEEKDWLRNTLEKIGAVKREDRNLKILISLMFTTNEYVEDLFESVYSRTQSIKTIKGLAICLNLYESTDHSTILEEKIRKILKKYPQQIRNWMVKLENTYESLEYIKIDGEKEQIFHDRSWL